LVPLGDGGAFDDEGLSFQISESQEDIIITGGENVSSIEIEDVIVLASRGCRGRESSACRTKSGRNRQGARRLCRPAPRSTNSEIDRALPGAHRTLQVPDVDRSSAPSSPALPTGKLQKFRLREPYWRDMEKQVN
jgi:acyl-CoA synthetase (AMP-forming)/AMP-acid ligase II